MAGRRTQDGLVVGQAMDKTVIVLVARIVRHQLYGKTLRRTTRLKAHDPQRVGAVGARVEVMESRPQSRGTHWRVVRVLQPPPQLGPAVASEVIP